MVVYICLYASTRKILPDIFAVGQTRPDYPRKNVCAERTACGKHIYMPHAQLMPGKLMFFNNNYINNFNIIISLIRNDSRQKADELL